MASPTSPAPKPPKRDRDPAYRFWITLWPCCICELQPKPVPSLMAECAHIETKARAGDRDNCVPLCHAHHTEWHQHGQATFQRKYRVVLAARARWFTREYDREVKAWAVEGGGDPLF